MSVNECHVPLQYWILQDSEMHVMARPGFIDLWAVSFGKVSFWGGEAFHQDVIPGSQPQDLAPFLVASTASARCERWLGSVLGRSEVVSKPQEGTELRLGAIFTTPRKRKRKKETVYTDCHHFSSIDSIL